MKFNGRPAYAGRLGIELQFANQRVEIEIDLVGILVGVHPEITEVTTLAAKRNVQVHPERNTRNGLGLHRGNCGPLDVFLRPDGKRGIVRDEVAADLCFFVGFRQLD